jgi:hypothetical protein
MHLREEAKHKEIDIEKKKEENDAGKFLLCAEQWKKNP